MSEENYVYRVKPAEQAIEGLDALRRAIFAWDRYRKLRSDFEEGDVLSMPTRPNVDIGDIKRKYPRAAAYLEAEHWNNSTSFRKSALGQRAMDRILAGEDHAKVLEEMRNAWAAFKVAQGN